MRPAASIIIPTHNHAAYLTAAIDSARQQTVPCEVIVIDDGSTDGTVPLLWTFTGIDRILFQRQSGPAAARNAGLERATGEFVMFLDGDDTIEPTKVARQLSCDKPWVVCDILIDDHVRETFEYASQRYHYNTYALDGDVEPLLRKQNLFPIHSPLVRRDLIADARFDDPRFPEDWYFWHQVSLRTPCYYLAEVLGTYYKRTTGRSRLQWKPRPVTPTIVRPVRLNLGCGNPKNDSWHPLDGLINMDPYIDGWRFQDGLPEFPDASVSGITISHALMFVPAHEWVSVLTELRRVLVPGGVLRLTEDATDVPGHPASGGWKGSEPFVSLTSAANLVFALRIAGFSDTLSLDPFTTHYMDRSLMQSWHAGEPSCVFIEGIK